MSRNEWEKVEMSMILFQGYKTRQIGGKPNRAHPELFKN